MRNINRQLQHLFERARESRRQRLQNPADAPYAFASRVAACWHAELEATDGAAAWDGFLGWALGLACAAMLLSLAVNRGGFSLEWSPALPVAKQLSESVLLP